MMIYMAKKTSADRKIIKIAVSEGAKEAIERFAQKYDMKEFAVASRFYEWFAVQDDVYQRAVMGMLHGLEVDAARAFMERLTKKSGMAGEPPKDIEVGQGGVLGGGGNSIKPPGQQTEPTERRVPSGRAKQH